MSAADSQANLDYIRGAFERWELRADEWTQLADGAVLATGSIHARGRESGVDLDQPIGWLFRFRDSRMVRYEVFYDPDEARRAAGIG